MLFSLPPPPPSSLPPFLHLSLQVRLQTQAKPAPGEKPMFTGTFDCAYKTVKNEVRLCACVFVKRVGRLWCEGDGGRWQGR